MSPPIESPKESKATPKASSLGKLTSALIFGTAFGFLLQKGGVGKYNVLIGQLLLQDYTVVKIMMTAIIVGMVGVHLLHHHGVVKLHLKPTRIGAQLIGGCLFGIGFALIAYCPGTGAVALGQGSWDVLFGMAGLVLGSYVFAEVSGILKRTVETWGDKGVLTLVDLIPVRLGLFIPGFALLLIFILVVIERFEPS